MLDAACDGDLKRVQELAGKCPPLLTCQYDYTAPLHLAVREGHLDVVPSTRPIAIICFWNRS